MTVDLLFYVFSSILVLSSLMIIIVQNSIYSVLFLVLSFVSSASLLFLLKCEFIALLFIIIYVGAIAVLFLFVVMMLDVKITNLTKYSVKYFPFGIVVSTVFLVEILFILSKNFKANPYKNSILFNEYQNWYDKLDSLTDLEVLGQILYTHYILEFLVAGFILFLAVIGAVLLTINFSKQNNTNQIISKQLSRNYENSVRH